MWTVHFGRSNETRKLSNDKHHLVTFVLGAGGVLSVVVLSNAIIIVEIFILSLYYCWRDTASVMLAKQLFSGCWWLCGLKNEMNVDG